eukprot:Awhi_evm1s3201
MQETTQEDGEVLSKEETRFFISIWFYVIQKDGHKKFQAIFISGDLEEDFIRPCGSCRQFLAE